MSQNIMSPMQNVTLWRACNLTSFSPCLTGPVDYPFASRHKGPGFKSPGGYSCETRIPLLALTRYIGDHDVIDHCGLVWGGPRPEPSLGPRADNVIIQLDLTQLSCPSFMLTAGLPSGFTTDAVSCKGGALWRACNLTSFSPCLTCPVDYLFASCHKGPRFKYPGGYLCETGNSLLVLSRYNLTKRHQSQNISSHKTSPGKLKNTNVNSILFKHIF
jgi:hypothetical protein